MFTALRKKLLLRGFSYSLFALTVCSARADILADFTDALTAGNPTQLGRLSRNAIPQDWSGGELFPGVITPTTTYNYAAYIVHVGLTPYLQIDMDAPTTTEFASAYLGTYNPADLATNWLGDAGVSGNYFGVNPLFFQVVAPLNSDVVVVVNNTTAGVFGNPYHITVEGYIDTMYTPTGVPEPGTLTIGAVFLLLFAGWKLRRRMSAVKAGLVIGTALVIVVFTAAPALAQPISDTARQQIAEILSVKRGFTAAEKKMDSRLVFAAKAARGELGSYSWAAIAAGETPNPGDMVAVDIRAAVSDSLIGQLRAAGVQVDTAMPAFGMIRGSTALGNVNAIAALPGVVALSRSAEFHTNGGAPTARRRPPAPTTESLLRRLGLSFIGALTSQGYISHMVNTEIASLGYTGAGVKVGVLSDSASPARVAALIASGDLPANTVVLPGQAGSGSDEGAAMMEIVSDMAPGAQLYFAMAGGGVASFAANILALQQAGCKVIVDDITYFNEGAFQDGPIARAVNTVTGLGTIYFSSAANSGNKTSGTSGTWEGDFLDGGAVSGPIVGTGETGNIHNFQTVAAPQNYDVLTAATNVINLKWSDPLAASANDYDLFLLNSTGTSVTAFSAAAQTGTQDPYEAISKSAGFAAGSRIVVVLYAGAARALRVDSNRGLLSLNTTGSTFGHNAGLNTVSMAATYWNSARTGTRPFTGAANRIEVFSSDGPRKIFFYPDGSPITPGNYLFATSGGTTLSKPDLTAADGVSTKTPGFLPFFGTSAAAPHAAGIAALILQAKPGYTPAEVRAAMISSALDTMAPGPDRDSGYGIAMAYQALKYALTH